MLCFSQVWRSKQSLQAFMFCLCTGLTFSKEDLLFNIFHYVFKARAFIWNIYKLKLEAECTYNACRFSPGFEIYNDNIYINRNDLKRMCHTDYLGKNILSIMHQSVFITEYMHGRQLTVNPRTHIFAHQRPEFWKICDFHASTEFKSKWQIDELSDVPSVSPLTWFFQWIQRAG